MSPPPRLRRSAAGVAVVALAAAVVLVTAGARGHAPARSDVAVSVDRPAPTAIIPSPSPSPTAVASPSPTTEPDPHVGLRARLSGVLDDPELAVSEGLVSIAIRDAEGRVVLDRDAHRPLLPASTQKLVTAAAALRSMGPEHRFTTQVLATGPVLDDGTLDGDLVLLAGGDPVLGTAGYGRYVYPVRPRTPLEELAVRIRTGGVERVAGRVVADRGRFGGDSAASGWKRAYWYDFDARHITGLTVDGGLVVGLRLPPEDDAAVVGATVAGDDTSPTVEDEPWLLLEAIPADVEPDVQLELSPDPPVEAARQLQRLLAARAVAVRPEVGVTTSRPDGVVLASVRSDPLAHILRHTVQRSDNQVADTLFRELGVAVLGDGTWEGGAMAVRSALQSLSLPWSGVVLADGSGLSRDDRLTAAFLAELDADMVDSPLGDTWASLMAVSGREGTLRHRLRGTPGEGRLLGKTGTLDDVAAVAGTVTGPGDTRFHLAVVGNDVGGADREVVRRIVDELTLALVDELDRSAVRP